MSRQWVPSSFNSLKRESWRPQPTSSWTPSAHSTTESGAPPNQAGPSGSTRRSPSPSQSRTRRLSSDYSRRDQPTSSYRPQPRNTERSRSRSRSRDRDDRRDRSGNGHGRVKEDGGRGSTDRKPPSPDGRRDRDRADERGSGHDRNRDFDGDRDRDRRRSKEWNAKHEDRSWGGWKDKMDSNRQDDRRDDSRRSNAPSRNDTGGRSWHTYNERGSSKKKKVDSRVLKGYGKNTDLYRPTPTGPRASSKTGHNGRGRRESPDYAAPPRRDSPTGRRESPDYAVGADRDRSRGRSDSSSTASSTPADRKRRPVSPRYGNAKRYRERSPTTSDASPPRRGRSPSREAPFPRRSSPSPAKRPSGRGKYSPDRDSPSPPPHRRSPSPPHHRSPSPPRRPRSPFGNQTSARNRSTSPVRAPSPPSGWKRQNLASQDDLFRSGGPGRPEDRAPGRWGRHPPDRRPAASDRRRDHEPARATHSDWHARDDQNRSQQGAERNGVYISPGGNGNHNGAGHQTWQPPASDSFGMAPVSDSVPMSPPYRNGHLHSVHEQHAASHAHDAQHLPKSGAALDSQLAGHSPEPVRISFGSNATNGSDPASMKRDWNTIAPPHLKTPLQRLFNDTTPTSSKRTSPSPPDVDMDIETSPRSAGPAYPSKESVFSEAQYSAHLSTIAPYIQAAFSQWWSQNATPALYDFLVHYFGRPPSQTEVSQIQQLLSMRRELNNGNRSGRPYQQGPSEGYRPASQGAPTISLPPPPSEPTAVHPSPPSESNDAHPAKASRGGNTYDLLTCVGEGTYGKVYKAKKNDTGLIVALKRIRMEGEKDGFPVTAMREIKLLQNLRHENVIRLHEMMVSKGSVYMVFEYMEHDLTGLLSLQGINFTPANLKSLNYQMLSGLAYLHDKSILHRDMKGSNILLNARGELKLGDFGLARVYSKFKRDDYTNRVITLWYRSPELLLGETVYGPTVDTFSAGCIMLELFTTKPVFQGNDEIHQLEVIYSILGTPSEEDWPDVKDLPWYELVKPKESLPSKFREIFSKWLSPAGLDLAQGLLAFDPARRLLADQAMQTPYFTSEAPPMEKPLQLSGIGEHHEMSAKADRHRRRQEGK